LPKPVKPVECIVGPGLGAPKLPKPVKPIECVVGAGTGTVGLLNAPKDALPAGLATSVGVGGAPKSGPVVRAAVVPGARGPWILLKSDPPFGTAGVVRVSAVARGLPKLPKGPVVLTAGAVVVALGRVAAGNVPNNEGALGGSV